MTVIVVATGPPVLEQALLDSDCDEVLAVVPKAYAELRSDVEYPVVVVENMADFSALAGIARRCAGDATAVLAVQEDCMAPAAFLRDLLDLPGARLGEAIRFTNKDVMKRRLRDAGVPVARHERLKCIDQVPEAAEALGWPLVVKPATGGGTSGVWKLRDLDEFQALRADGSLTALDSAPAGILAEEFLQVRDEYHCDTLRVAGEDLLLISGRYPKPLLAGLSDFSGTTLLPDSEAEQLGLPDLYRQAANALGLTDGFTHCEIFDTPNGLVLGEIAARPGGAGLPRAIALKLGVDVRGSAVDLALGRPLRPRGPSRPGVVTWLTLPARPGRFTKLSSAEELEALDPVIEAVLRYQPGDEFDRPRGSTAYAGHVYLESPSLDHVPADIAQVKNAYHYEVAAKASAYSD